MTSEIHSVSGVAVRKSSGYAGAPSGRLAARTSKSRSTFSPVRAETGTTAAKAWRCDISAISGRSFSLRIRSILFRARTAGTPALAMRSRMNFSPGPRSSAASTTKSTRSAEASASVASRTMAAFIRYSGLWIPGVSTRAISAPGRRATPRMRLRVVCGLSETIATFSPTRALTSVDLPALGRPTTATEPARNTVRRS